MGLRKHSDGYGHRLACLVQKGSLYSVVSRRIEGERGNDPRLLACALARSPTDTPSAGRAHAYARCAAVAAVAGSSKVTRKPMPSLPGAA